MSRLPGFKHSEETKAKLKASHKGMRGMHHTEETRAKISLALRGRRLSDEHKAKIRASDKETWQDPKLRAQASAIHKAQWRDPEFTERMMKAQKKRPNQAELRLEDMLDRHFPSEWKFVGDGQVNLGGRFPDFINVNGKKEVIELFSAYWHPIFDAAQRKEHYRQYGFRVAIIWQDELKDEQRLVKTLRRKFREEL